MPRPVSCPLICACHAFPATLQQKYDDKDKDYNKGPEKREPGDQPKDLDGPKDNDYYKDK
jgi:hypothetical protein